eukprot:g30115.t1
MRRFPRHATLSPAKQLPGSLGDERFARQYRYELPPEFPLASPCSGIDHHLSGPNRYALTQIYRKRRSVDSAPPR